MKTAKYVEKRDGIDRKYQSSTAGDPLNRNKQCETLLLALLCKGSGFLGLFLQPFYDREKAKLHKDPTDCRPPQVKKFHEVSCWLAIFSRGFFKVSNFQAYFKKSRLECDGCTKK